MAFRWSVSFQQLFLDYVLEGFVLSKQNEKKKESKKSREPHRESVNYERCSSQVVCIFTAFVVYLKAASSIVGSFCSVRGETVYHAFVWKKCANKFSYDPCGWSNINPLVLQHPNLFLLLLFIMKQNSARMSKTRMNRYEIEKDYQDNLRWYQTQVCVLPFYV